MLFLIIIQRDFKTCLLLYKIFFFFFFIRPLYLIINKIAYFIYMWMYIIYKYHMYGTYARSNCFVICGSIVLGFFYLSHISYLFVYVPTLILFYFSVISTEMFLIKITGTKNYLVTISHGSHSVLIITLFFFYKQSPSRTRFW